ncbi:hypothetical protein PDE_05584 [Penicillium oxalicum 114-2]|uniref:DNA ligase D 3'-phosphoesterase domain-containing protein n=1 Tax=Penicillium oxalicum (strain 114-2 / CGMCC 5302) TaxID=933388 RepID=S8B7D2_PENO1|nr:hypothetical protein PDE_05584 [Penicillium oxalicum 114-2]
MKRSRGTDSNNSGSGDPNNRSQSNRRKTEPLVASLQGSVSPPPRRKTATSKVASPQLAAIEAGDLHVENHLQIFATRLRQQCRPSSVASEGVRRLNIEDYADLYRRNNHAAGRHFVIHQHDHPIAGPHYDLRLQFSETSSVSWSIMYGLPGDPNSERLNRNATETRVHCLWNHLVETASDKTGSLLIWDTGEYEILPYLDNVTGAQTDESESDSDFGGDDAQRAKTLSESAKLKQAFHSRKIRLRLHGTRLPRGYTLLLRMDKATDYARPAGKGPKRRRCAPLVAHHPPPAPASTSSFESRSASPSTVQKQKAAIENNQSATKISADGQDILSDEDLNYQIRKNNAYPGSSNTIGSIHQRRWYLSMDRAGSGFEPRRIALDNGRSKKTWVRSQNGFNSCAGSGFEPFYVRGPEVERSVVTGRLAWEVLADEGVQGFVARKGWRPVLR